MAEVDNRRRSFLKLGLLILLIASGVLLARLTPLGGYLSPEGVGNAMEWVGSTPWAPVVFVLVYAAATAMAVPGTILTLAGGGLFGFFWGTVYNSIAANIGANAAFLIARGLGRDGVRRLIGDDSAAIRKMDAVVGQHAFRGLLTLRLIPLVPFNALNFGSGLMPLRWSTYALATVVGIFPGTVVYTFFADALLQGSQEASQDALIRVLIAGALLILLTFLPTIVKRLGIRVPGLTALVFAATCVAAGPGDAQQAAAELPGHEKLTPLLAEVVDGPSVDYTRLKEKRGALDEYLAHLSETDPAQVTEAPPSVRLAFWINAYNACMLKRVVDHYPIQRANGIQRLKNTVAGRPANSVWQIPDVFTGAHCDVAGEPRSQDAIEHEIIRPMGDPRIHFALNCAARGCPALRPEAYRGEGLDEQLDDQVRRFMDDPRHFDATDGRVRVNRVLEWFGDDFGGAPGVLQFFHRYASDEAKALLESSDAELEFFEYDWTLNDVTPGSD